MKKGTLILGASLLSVVSMAAQGVKPNVVFFLMDDMGYGDLSIMGSTRIATPNIDALAANGKMLTQHYAGAPVSAPSRCVLLTGRHTGHAAIRGNDEWDERGDVWSMQAMARDERLEGQRPMPKGERTLARELQRAGYRTACIGKWGLGAPGSVSAPNEAGFDFFYGYNCQRVSHSYYPAYLYRNGEREYINAVPMMGAKLDQGADALDPHSYDKFNKGQYAPELLQKEVLRFIDQNSDRPFFLWFTTPIPHASLAAPQRWIDHYHKIFGDEKPFPGNHYSPVRYPRATYAAMVSYVDEQIGEVVAELKAKGVYDNTIIIFTSDNGPSSEGGGDSPWLDSARPFRSAEGWGKRSLHEGGIRVPTIVSWSGHIAPRSSSHTMSAFQDWFPTLLAAAGVEPIDETLDGVNILPTLLGAGQQEEHDFLYWEYADGGSLAVRCGEWKMIVTDIRRKPVYWLYNLAFDVREQTNLADRYPEKLAQLRAMAALAHSEPENKVFSFGLPLPLGE
ncbi:MAG: arylsulfatase [Mucinivorans sp.]